MTRLEDHYRLHPFTFFITHMVKLLFGYRLWELQVVRGGYG